jgi:hypothetical protein
MEYPHSITYCDLFKKYLNETETNTGILNQNKTLALEALCYKLQTGMQAAMTTNKAARPEKGYG